MGVPQQDCRTVAELIGVKTFLNEFVAYTALSQLIDNTESYRDWETAYPNSTAVYTGRDIYLPETNQTLVKGIIEVNNISSRHLVTRNKPDARQRNHGG